MKKITSNLTTKYLCAVNSNSNSEIARKINSTYSHIVKLSNNLIKNDLIESNKLDKRTNKITLTKKGQKAKEFLLKLEKLGL